MAEVTASQMLYHDSFSRGLNVKSLSNEKNATKVLYEWNIQKIHFPQQIQKSDVQKANLILTMTQKQKEALVQQYQAYQTKIFTLSECATGKNTDVLDPFGKGISTYRSVRDQIFEYENEISSKGWICKP